MMIHCEFSVVRMRGIRTTKDRGSSELAYALVSVIYRMTVRRELTQILLDDDVQMSRG